MAAGYGTSPFFVFSGYDGARRVLPVRRAAVRRASGPATRRTGSTGTRGGRCSARPRRSTPRATTRCGSRATSRRATPEARGCIAAAPAIEKTVRVPRAGRVHGERRPRHDPAVGDQRRTPRRLQHEDADPRDRRGRRAAVQDRPGPGGAPGDRSSSGPPAPAAGATRCGRDPELVLRDVLRGLVSPESAQLHYGVVLGAHGVDADATARRRAQLAEERGEQAQFDFGELPESMPLAEPDRRRRRSGGPPASGQVVLSTPDPSVRPPSTTSAVPVTHRSSPEAR